MHAPAQFDFMFDLYQNIASKDLYFLLEKSVKVANPVVGHWKIDARDYRRKGVPNKAAEKQGREFAFRATLGMQPVKNTT